MLNSIFKSNFDKNILITNLGNSKRVLNIHNDYLTVCFVKEPTEFEESAITCTLVEGMATQMLILPSSFC